MKEKHWAWIQNTDLKIYIHFLTKIRIHDILFRPLTCLLIYNAENSRFENIHLCYVSKTFLNTVLIHNSTVDLLIPSLFLVNFIMENRKHLKEGMENVQ